MPSWDINFNHGIDVTDSRILTPSVEIEAYKLSVLKIPIPPGLKDYLNQINIIRQIRGTTAIEGNLLTEVQVKEVLKKDKAETKDEQEARNSQIVHNFILKWTKDNPGGRVSEDFILKLHELATRNIDYENNIPGRYRQHKVVAGEYLPPDHELIPQLMSQFVIFINTPEVVVGLRPLIRAILAHFYLISIHPFGDGNGRTSRALEAYILYSGGYNVYGFYSLANYFYQKRNDYIQQLMDARFKYNGRLQEFVIFALNGFVTELQFVQDSIIEFVRKAVYRDYLDACFTQGFISSRCEAVARIISDVGDEGISEIEFRTKKHSLSREFYKDVKSPRTLDRDLKQLQQYHLLTVESNRIKANFDFLTSLENTEYEE